MARFVQVKMVDQRFGDAWVNPDTVALVVVVEGVTTLTLVTGDVMAIEGVAAQAVNTFRGKMP